MQINPLRTEGRLTPEQAPNQLSFQNKKSPNTLIRTALSAISYFIFYFLQQVAEIFAPMLLIIGLVWKFIPTLLHSMMHLTDNADPQIRDIVTNGSNLIPTSINFSGYTLSASTLIFWGILLLALAALSATLTSFFGYKN